jgi:zinc finger RNA-binding protein
VRSPEDIPSPQERKPLPPFTPDDRLLLEKHTDICPTETELDRIFLVLSITERGLKLLSDQLSQEDIQKKEEEEETEKVEEESQHRTLKGLMRVGPAAMDLLLAGDKKAELVVICAEKPTESLLIRVLEKLPDQLKAAGAEEGTKVLRDSEGNGILVIHVGTPVEEDVTIKVSLTSPLMRASMGESSANV